MGKIIKKAGILCGVFIAALVIFFAFEKNTSEKSDTVYTSMEEATLPVVYTDMYNSEMNVLHGYLQEMDRVDGDDALTILPADRKLGRKLRKYQCGSADSEPSYQGQAVSASFVCGDGTAWSYQLLHQNYVDRQ